eukprot:Rmarinus@m.4507
MIGGDVSTVSDAEGEVMENHPNTAGDVLSVVSTFIADMQQKPLLLDASPSFVLDFLRTLQARYRNEYSCTRAAASPSISLLSLSEPLLKNIFLHLDGPTLLQCLTVCKDFHRVASDPRLWKSLCLRIAESFKTDPHLWHFFRRRVARNHPKSYQLLYVPLRERGSWTCALKKTGRFVCNLRILHLWGPPPNTRPSELVVERRFNVDYLDTFILPDPCLLYFEPATPEDEAEYYGFISYLKSKHRAGLALEEDSRIIFIPPCSYAERQFGYRGSRLLGVMQIHFPPLLDIQAGGPIALDFAVSAPRFPQDDATSPTQMTRSGPSRGRGPPHEPCQAEPSRGQESPPRATTRGQVSSPSGATTLGQVSPSGATTQGQVSPPSGAQGSSSGTAT